MRLSHLIIAHANPLQLERLIQSISCEHADIYIHLDKKTNLKEFVHLASLQNVFFIKERCRVTWGAYSMVEATLSSLQQILDTKIDYSHINFLSGQDYPLQKPCAIAKYFIDHPDKSFMKYLDINEQWPEALPRLNKYDFSNFDFPLKYKLEYIVNKILPIKKIPEQLKPYGLSQWLTITPLHAQYVIDYLENHKNVAKYFSMTWGADELIFQTILLNSVHKNDIVNDYLRYIKFVKGAYRPNVLTLEDGEKMIKSGKLFARKFDYHVDTNVLDYLDKAINTH